MADIEKFGKFECLINLEDIIKESCKDLVDQIKVNALAKGLIRETDNLHYVDGWTWEISERYDHGMPTGIVHNKTKYRLSHLLEKGHDVKKKGHKVGEAPKFEHIKPAFEKESMAFMDRINNAKIEVKIKNE